MGSHTSTVSQKNAMVINFAQSHAQSRVSISFSRTISEIQNTGQYQRTRPWEVVRAWFREKNALVIKFVQTSARSRVSIGFSCTVSEIQNTGHSQCTSPWEAIPNVLAQAMSYEHDFVKKNDDHKLHANRVSIGFSRTISEIQNTGHSQRISRSDVICTVP
ncbi:hypothetical protein BHM03_00022159 [Ensete ventricosum]|nr:hypothetical protein BHM03_00022159 [Ensete ventricosum]